MSVTETEELYAELEEKLKKIYLENEDILKRAELSILVCEAYISRLKKLVLDSTFKSQQEEIEFFKHVKPRFTSKLMYNICLFNLEYRRPKNQHKIEKKYLQKQLKKINLFIEDNLEFYKYFVTGATYLDHRYFIRGVRDIHLLLDTPVHYFDRDFTTSHCHLISSIKANEMLQKHIREELKILKPAVNMDRLVQNQLNWTESKVALTELIYAIHSSGAINNGNVELGEIASGFEAVFNIDLKNYYRTYLEIRLRSNNNRTKFLKLLTNNLVKRLEEDDLK